MLIHVVVIERRTRRAKIFALLPSLFLPLPFLFQFLPPQYVSQHTNCRVVKARTLRSAATPLLIQPFARSHFAKRSFRCAAPSVWNSLPASVNGDESLYVFKSRLKTFLFRRSFNYYVYNRLPPAPLKLRPYGASQTCL